MTVDAPAQSNSRRSSSAPTTPHRPTVLQRAAARIIHWVIRGIGVTLRYRWERDPLQLPTAGLPYIFVVWHNRLALSIVMYQRWMKAIGRPDKMAAMVSASRDGALLARVLELLGVKPVRGSSSRRGGQALLELNSWLERGYDAAITIDGPRGPRYQVKPGVVGLAQVTGCAIVPSSYRLSRKWTLRSWDRFQIPMPFSTCFFTFDDPIRIPRELSDAEREAARRDLERRLAAITTD